MSCSLVPLFLCVYAQAFTLELYSSFITLNYAATQPLLIAKQMAAHNLFFLNNPNTCCSLSGGQGKARMTFTKTPLNETMNTVLIQTAGWGCGHCWQGAIVMVFMKHCVLTPPGTLKDKGQSVCR